MVKSGANAVETFEAPIACKMKAVALNDIE